LNRNPPMGPQAQGNGMGMQNMGGMSAAQQVMQGMNPQAQMALFKLVEEQAKMMTQILTPQQQAQIFSGQMFNPAANGGFSQNPKPFEQRISGRGRGRGGRQNDRRQQQQPASGQDDSMDTDATTVPMNEDSAMDGNDAQEPKDPANSVCRFNLSCTKADCPFAHQSPSAPPGVAIDTSDVCDYGAACKNHKCTGKHPSPAQKTNFQSEQECKFYANCTKPYCPFKHPSMPACRNGPDCSVPGCKFFHNPTKCKFNPCTKPDCPFKHDEGQKRGRFEDKVWVANGGEGGEGSSHVSERRFVADEGNEELIIPGSGASQEEEQQQPQTTGMDVIA
jgi:nuclear polyadenylated RNA-binding protein NAB2